MKRIVNLLLFASALYAEFHLSVGDFEVLKTPKGFLFPGERKKRAGEIVSITDALQKHSRNVNAVTMWITKEWHEDWYQAARVQKEIIDRGYLPVFIVYYFADDISPTYVLKHESAYFAFLVRFLRYLKKLHGKKVVILNPEYNMHGVEKWKGMNSLFLRSFSLVRQAPDLLVGPCVGDFGNYQKVDEPEEWKLFDPSLRIAARSADFIAFQEMRALTRNSAKEIGLTPERAYHLARYLHRTYHKPTVLAYAAISSYGKGGEKLQADVFKGFVRYLPEMVREARLEMFGLFHYFDYPGHKGYFKKAEEHFGVLRADGRPKPAFAYFNRLGPPSEKTSTPKPERPNRPSHAGPSPATKPHLLDKEKADRAKSRKSGQARPPH